MKDKSYKRKKCSSNNMQSTKNGGKNNSKVKDRTHNGRNWDTYKALLINQNDEVSKHAGSSRSLYKKQSKHKTKHASYQPEKCEKHTHSNNNNHCNTSTRCIAMDCEMVGINEGGKDSMLARVSIVNEYGNCIYNQYVQPTQEVVDYRTPVSGIEQRHMEDLAKKFNVVQKDVACIIKGRIVVGHSLKHDFEVLRLSHPKKYLRDTSTYKPFREIANGRTPSLKRLAQELLDMKIQEGQHNSIEDARAAMQLYLLHKAKWEKDIK